MTELLFYLQASTLPFHLFAYVPFWDHLRFSKRTTALLLMLEQMLYTLLFIGLLYLGISIENARLIALPFYATFFFFFVNMDKGKIAFLYIFTTDYQMLISGTVSYLGNSVFHFALFTWPAGLWVLFLFFLTLPFMLLYICKTASFVFDIYAPAIWKTVWILPLSTSIMVLLYTHSFAQVNISMLISRTLLMICMFLIYFYIIQALRQTQEHAVAQERARNMEHLIKIQANHYALIQSRMEETRRAQHDLRQHWRALQGYIDNKDIPALSDYIKTYSKNLPTETTSVYCKNYAINAVLHYYAEKAVQKDIDIEISFRTAEESIIPEPEFCVLLGNLLENAWEACLTSDDKRFIRIHALQKENDTLTLTVDNTSPRPPQTEGESFYSSKHEGFGIGTASIRMIAEKYHGDARFQWKDSVFFASILLIRPLSGQSCDTRSASSSPE